MYFYFHQLENLSYKYLLHLSHQVFKIKENVYVTEFELCETFDGYVGMAAVLSDSSAIYVSSDTSNVCLNALLIYFIML